jgi:hypothetical protein
VNGDGNLDLVVANQCSSVNNCPNGDGSVGVLLGNGDGTFQTPTSYDAGIVLASSVIVTDVNGDGKPDLVVVGGGVSVLLSNGDGTFQPAVTYGSGGAAAVSVAAADVNDDGKLDLVVANQCANPCSGTIATSLGEGSVGVLLGNGDGTFQSAQTYLSGGDGATSVSVADLRHNGELDLVVSNFCSVPSCRDSYPLADGTVGVLLGNRDGTFQPVVLYDSGGASTGSVAIADVNGDGKLDLLTANCGPETCGPGRPGGTVGVLLGNGDGTFQPPVSYDAANGPISIAAADLNGDGTQDVVVANWGTSDGGSNNGAGSVLLGSGDGTFQSVQTYLSGGDEATSVAVADLTGDGRPDVVLADTSGPYSPPGKVSVLLNKTTSPPATTTTTLASSLNPSVLGQTVTFTAAVSSASGTPTGTIIHGLFNVHHDQQCDAGNRERFSFRFDSGGWHTLDYRCVPGLSHFQWQHISPAQPTRKRRYYDDLSRLVAEPSKYKPDGYFYRNRHQPVWRRGHRFRDFLLRNADAGHGFAQQQFRNPEHVFHDRRHLFHLREIQRRYQQCRQHCLGFE